MHALGGADVQRLLFAALAAGPVAQPHAGGHDDHARTHADFLLARVDDGAIDLAVAVARDLHDLRVVGHGRAMEGGGARDVQRQPRVIHPRIEIQEAPGQVLRIEGGAVREDLRLGQLLVQDAFAPAAGQVVRPEQALECLGEPLVEHAVALHHGKQEWQALHQMARVAAQALALKQGMAHQAQVALLDVAQAAVHHLRRLGRGARGKVVLLDQRHTVAAQAGVQRRVGAGDPAADDEDVEGLAAQAVQLRPAVEPQRFGAGHGGAFAARASGWQTHHVDRFS
ncbi:hypothetical protein D3C81_1276310 [compost metagenome]